MGHERRLSRRDLLIGAGIGLAAASVAAPTSAAELTQARAENPLDSVLAACAGPVILFGVIGFGFYVMVGGLNRKGSSGDPEIDRLQKQIDDLKKRRGK